MGMSLLGSFYPISVSANLDPEASLQNSASPTSVKSLPESFPELFKRPARPAEQKLALARPCAPESTTKEVIQGERIDPTEYAPQLCQPPSGISENTEPAIWKQQFSSSISLCNWNVWGLPLVTKSGTRIKRIAEHIAYGCDIYSGQEHWSLLDRASFREQVKSRVPSWNFTYFGHPFPLHPGSGLVVGSIWPILKKDYAPWPGLIKNLGYKGVGYVQIKTPQGLLDVYNLHLAAGNVSNLKEQQLEHMTNFVKATHDPALPVVINGDFNFTRGWTLPKAKVDAIDQLSQALGITPIGFKDRIEYTFINHRLRYFDHRVLAEWDTPRKVWVSEPFKKQFSDHPGIVTRVLIEDPSP